MTNTSPNLIWTPTVKRPALPSSVRVARTQVGTTVAKVPIDFKRIRLSAISRGSFFLQLLCVCRINGSFHLISAPKELEHHVKDSR